QAGAALSLAHTRLDPATGKHRKNAAFLCQSRPLFYTAPLAAVSTSSHQAPRVRNCRLGYDLRWFLVTNPGPNRGSAVAHSYLSARINPGTASSSDTAAWPPSPQIARSSADR